jgi:hypothetical protein
LFGIGIGIAIGIESVYDVSGIEGVPLADSLAPTAERPFRNFDPDPDTEDYFEKS